MDKEDKAVLIALVGFVAVWTMYVTSAFAYIALAWGYKIDLLIPFKVVIFVGLGFTIFFSLLNISTNEKDTHLLIQGLEVGLLAISGIGTYFTATSILGRSAELQIPFDYGLASGCTIGTILGLIGLGAVTYVIFFKKR